MSSDLLSNCTDSYKIVVFSYMPYTEMNNLTHSCAYKCAADKWDYGDSEFQSLLHIKKLEPRNAKIRLGSIH